MNGTVYKMRDKLILVLFGITWLEIAFFYQYELVLFIALQIMAINVIYVIRDTEAIKYYLIGSMAYFLEFIPVLTGAWSYYDSLIGVPVWISPLAGITFLTVGYVTFKIRNDNNVKIS